MFNVLFAACGITFMLYFAFQRIIDAAGLYFLSVWAPITGYFAVAVILAVALHRYWTVPYTINCDDEDEKHGLFPSIFEDVFVRD